MGKTKKVEVERELILRLAGKRHTKSKKVTPNQVGLTQKDKVVVVAHNKKTLTSKDGILSTQSVKKRTKGKRTNGPLQTQEGPGELKGIQHTTGGKSNSTCNSNTPVLKSTTMLSRPVGNDELPSSTNPDQNVTKKRRKKPKKTNSPLSKNEIDRKKVLANIVHKKEATSSNWKNFVGKQMHLQNEEPLDPEIKKNVYTGTFRKNRKNQKILAATKNANPSLVEKSSDSVEATLPTSKKESNQKKLTRYIGIDCEMVGVDDDGKDNMLARVSLVNKFGECIYDKFVQPKEDVVDYRTHVSGVRPADLKNAEPFEVVQREVAEIIRYRILVGHALRNDLKVLYLSHPKKRIRDTSKYAKFRQINEGRTPSLKKLTAKILGVIIQEGEHNSIIDARAAMQLYMMYQKEWEEDLRTSKGRKSNNRSQSNAKQK